jgi:O-glycosyl hydrolase
MMPALTRLTTAAVVAFVMGSGVAPSPRTQAVVDPTNVYVGHFEGWGTSLAWGGNIVGGWSDRNRTAIADLLFSTTTGLGLNIVRYHIGAGLNPNSASIGCGVHRPGSPLPLYQPAPGVWDWTVDANQRWFAQAAQARGANLFLAYASAPPYWMTKNGCTNGGDNAAPNLKGWWGYNGSGCCGAYNATTSYSGETDESVTVAFTGTKIEFYGMTSSDSGIGAISIDGGPEVQVDLFSSTRQGNVLLYTSPTLASGAHTLKIRVTGTKFPLSSAAYISIDRVVIHPDGITVDDQVRGSGLNQFNYRWRHYRDFADYLTEVVRHFRDHWGITFNYLDPLNEPSVAWAKTKNQEGNVFDQAGQNEIINRTGESLVAKGLTGTSVAAPDDFSPGLTNTNFKSYSSSAKGYISTITAHTYETSPADAADLRKTAVANGKKLWLSEFTTGGEIKGTNPNHIQPAVSLAIRIVGDMNDLRPSSWLLWDGIESWEQNEKEHGSWGTIWARYLDRNERWTVAKQYYGYKNFTRFIRPGCRIIASGDAQTLAAYDSSTQQLVLVTYNDGNSNRSMTYDLSLFSAIGTATPHRTSSNLNLAQLAPVPLTTNQLTVTLPEKSITTYLMSNVTGPLGRGRLDP